MKYEREPFVGASIVDGPTSGTCKSEFAPSTRPGTERAVLWLLCHYPETNETDERVTRAYKLHQEWGLPIWLFGSSTARYPVSPEQLIKNKLVKRGVSPDAITCSADIAGIPESLDTVQETLNVIAAAHKLKISTIVCVSNRLQLGQVRGLLRREKLKVIYRPTPLQDWRLWYLMARLVLIPFAFAGVGPGFAPLKLVRRARLKIERWPF